MINKNHIASRRAALGMTIVEVMLTLAILGVLTALATPSFTGVMKNNRIRSQASDLMVNLAIARAEATKRGVRVTMCPSTNFSTTTPSCITGSTAWGVGYMIFADVNGNGAFDSGTDSLIAVAEPLSGGNVLAGTDTGGSAGFAGTNAAGTTITNRLQFRTSGVTNLPAGGGQFKLCDDRTGPIVGRMITISVTGRAQSNQTACP